MNNFKSKYQILITGLNLHHVLAFFEREKLNVSNLERIDNKNLRCKIDKPSFKLFKASPLSKAFNIKIERRFGFDNLFRQFLNSLGLIIGCLICLFSVLNLSSRVLAIHIVIDNHTCSNGEECIFQGENLEKLKECLKANGIYKQAPISSLPSNRELERSLMQSFKQVSGVNITVKGVHVYVDILEAKLQTIESDYRLTAEENGIVVSIDVTSGTSNVSLGDIVLKGQTLVSSSSNAPVSATIVLRSFYHESTIYNESQISYNRTGNTFTVNNLEIFNKSTTSSKTIPFSLYESETHKRFAFLNLFLPVKLSTTTYYELKAIETIVPYASMEENIKLNLTEKTRSLLPPNAEERNITFTTFQEGSRYRIDCYIETYLTIKK